MVVVKKCAKCDNIYDIEKDFTLHVREGRCSPRFACKNIKEYNKLSKSWDMAKGETSKNGKENTK